MVGRRHYGGVPRRLRDATGGASMNHFKWKEHLNADNINISPYDAFYQECVNVGKNLFEIGDLLLYKEKSRDDFVLVKIVEIRFIWIFVRIEGGDNTDVRWIAFNDRGIKPIENENFTPGTYRGATAPLQCKKYNWHTWIHKTLQKNERNIADSSKFYPISESYRPESWKIEVGQACLAFDVTGFNGTLCPVIITEIKKDINEVTLQYQGYTNRHKLHLNYFETREIFSYEMAEHMGLHIAPPFDEEVPVAPFRCRLTLNLMTAEEIHLSESPPHDFVFQTGLISTRAGDPDCITNVTESDLNSLLEKLIPAEYIILPPARAEAQPVAEGDDGHEPEAANGDQLIRFLDANRRVGSPHEEATDTSSEAEAARATMSSFAAIGGRPMSLSRDASSSSAEERMPEQDIPTSSFSSFEHSDSPGTSHDMEPRVQIKEEYPAPTTPTFSTGVYRRRVGPIALLMPDLHDKGNVDNKPVEYFTYMALKYPGRYPHYAEKVAEYQRKGKHIPWYLPKPYAHRGPSDAEGRGQSEQSRARTSSNANHANLDGDSSGTVMTSSEAIHPMTSASVSSLDAEKVDEQQCEARTNEMPNQQAKTKKKKPELKKIMKSTEKPKCTKSPGSSRSNHSSQRDRNLAEKEKASGVTDKVMGHLQNAMIEEAARTSKEVAIPVQKKSPMKAAKPAISKLGSKMARVGFPVSGIKKKTAFVPQSSPKAKPNSLVVASLLRGKKITESIAAASLPPARRRASQGPVAKKADDPPRKREPHFDETITEEGQEIEAFEPPVQQAVPKLLRRPSSPVAAARSAVEAASATVKPASRAVTKPAFYAPSSDSSTSASPPSYFQKITVERLVNSKDVPQQVNTNADEPVIERLRSVEQNETVESEKKGIEKEVGKTVQFNREKNGSFAPAPPKTPKCPFDYMLPHLFAKFPPSTAPSKVVEKAAISKPADNNAQQNEAVKAPAIEEEMRLAVRPSSSQAPVIFPCFRALRSRSRKASAEADLASSKKLRAEKQPAAAEEAVEPQQEQGHPEVSPIVQATVEHPLIYEPVYIMEGLNCEQIKEFSLQARSICRLGNHLDHSLVNSHMNLKVYKSKKSFTNILRKFIQDLANCVFPKKIDSFFTIIGAVDPHDRAGRPAFLIKVDGPYGDISKYVPTDGSPLRSYLWLRTVLLQLNVCPDFASFAGSTCLNCWLPYSRNSEEFKKKIFRVDFRILQEHMVPLPTPAEIYAGLNSQLDKKDIAKTFLKHNISYPLLASLTEEVIHFFCNDVSTAEACQIMAFTIRLRKSVWNKLEVDTRTLKEKNELYPLL